MHCADHKANWKAIGYEVIIGREGIGEYFFNCMVLYLSEDGSWSQFYHIIAQITEKAHPLFGDWYYVYAPEHESGTFCKVQEDTYTGILMIQRRVNEEHLYDAIRGGWVNLIRGAKEKYKAMYPEQYMDY